MADQLPEPPAPGSQPAFVRFLTKRWGMLLFVVLTAAVMMSTRATVETAKEARAANNRDFTASHNTSHGATLSGNQLAKQQEELEAAQAAVKAQQAALEKQIEEAKERMAAQTGAPPQVAVAQQLSPAQQQAEEIAKERMQTGWRSLWSSPIAATREVSTSGASPWSAPGAIGNGLTSSPQPRQEVSHTSAQTAQDGEVDALEADPANHTATDPNKARFAYDEAVGPYHIIPRYTLIGGTLLNQVNSETGGAVLIQLDPSDKVYLSGTKTLLLPEGTQMLGAAKSITAGGGNQHLLGMSIDEIRTPDQYSIAIPSIDAMSQNGQTGVTGHVDTHWLSKFGWSIMLAGFSGLSEIGNTTSGLSYSPSASFRSQFADSLAQQGIQQLEQRVFSVPNTIVIPAGTRVKAVLAADLPGVPEWANHRMPPGSL